MPSHRGNSKAYLLNKLRLAGEHASVAAIESGRMSTYSVATELGWRKRPETSGTSRRSNASKRRDVQARMLRAEPHPAAEQQELWLGVGDQPSVFASDDECRTAWIKHRALLMEWYGSHGRRPLSWWRYDSGDLRWPGYNRERSALYNANKLAPVERSEVEAYWRQEFALACDPNFTCCAGSGRVLSGVDAAAAHLDFVDIPISLAEVLAAEHDRAAHTINTLRQT